MNFPKRQCPLVIALLSITIATRVSSASTKPATNHSPPFWQFILREFIFKTISSLGHQDNDLYKKIQPFYGRTNPVVSNNLNMVVSSGNVYNIPSGKWILCQDGCKKCELCIQQKHEPAVKWTLRRVKRLTNFGLPKWDLRLTVVPQMDESFHVRKHLPLYNDVYVVNQDKSEGESDLVPLNTQQDFAFQKAQEDISLAPNGAKGSDNDEYRRSSTRFEKYRRRPPLYDSGYDPGFKTPAETGFQDDTTPRLVVGIDQYGKKHLIHLIPVDSAIQNLDQPSNYATSYLSSNNWENEARISRTIQQQDDNSYEKLIERIVNSFNSHRNFVEKFLFSDRELLNHNEAGIPLYSGYQKGGDDGFEEINLDGYRVDDSREINQYPSGLEYQEQTEEFRRYPDVTLEVNKPYDEYQDQNTMIEYEPYGVSGEGHEQKHQDERSLPLADVDRKRRNYFAKLMDPTVGHQNHTQTDESDTEFSIKRNFLENSTNQALVNLPLKINQTDPKD